MHILLNYSVHSAKENIFAGLQPCVFSLSECFAIQLYQVSFKNLLYSTTSQLVLQELIRFLEDRNATEAFSSLSLEVCQNSLR